MKANERPAPGTFGAAKHRTSRPIARARKDSNMTMQSGQSFDISQLDTAALVSGKLTAHWPVSTWESVG
jgi:hypothetical protein